MRNESPLTVCTQTVNNVKVTRKRLHATNKTGAWLGGQVERRAGAFGLLSFI